MKGQLLAGIALVVAACSTNADPPTSIPAASSTSSATLSTTTTTPAPPTTQVRPARGVEIVGEAFHIDGEVTNPGGPAEGLLLNSRMVQAVIDIENAFGPFEYPDTGRWDAERNTDEFVAALPEYVAAGLDAVTVNLQGGNPLAAPVDDRPDWRISAYRADGSLDPGWLSRLDRVLRAAEDEGLVVIIGLFYFGQDHRLADEAAVIRGLDEVVDWLMAGDHDNVLIEICNECNVHYDHAILRPGRVTELMERVRDRSGGRLAVSASLTGGNVPGESWIAASDFVLLHGNRQEASSITAMVDEVRASSAFAADPKPIVFNEDSINLANMNAALAAGAGWGYHDKGDNDYVNGFQAPPVNWRINTHSKAAFFEAVAQAAGLRQTSWASGPTSSS